MQPQYVKNKRALQKLVGKTLHQIIDLRRTISHTLSYDWRIWHQDGMQRGICSALVIKREFKLALHSNGPVL